MTAASQPTVVFAAASIQRSLRRNLLPAPALCSALRRRSCHSGPCRCQDPVLEGSELQPQLLWPHMPLARAALL